MSTARTGAIVAALVLAAFLAALVAPYYMDIFILTCFFGTLAVSWNLLAGLTGLMSLGHPLFVGIRAITSSSALGRDCRAWCSRKSTTWRRAPW